MTAEEDRASELFFPYAKRRYQELIESDLRFAYYTTADTAAKILRNREIWMRDARTMNDFREIEYGDEMLREYYHSDNCRNFLKQLNAIFPDINRDLEKRLNGWRPHILNSTFLACFSEHPQSEDAYGRLSMWRAYGRPNGVALIMKRDFFVTESPALGLFSSPVAYLDAPAFAEDFDRLTGSLIANAEFLTALGRDEVVNHLFQVFHMAMLCIKHPGFREEREWRAVLSPVYDETTKYQRVIETINGVPQTVIKVQLQDWPEDGIVGLELPKLLDRVIVGPSQFPRTIAQALASEMMSAGVTEHLAKLRISDIPLRTG